MRLLLHSLVAGVALAASGCRQLAESLFLVDVESEEVCLTQRQVALPALPPGPQQLHQDFLFPLGQLGSELPPGPMESSLRLRLFEVRVAEGEVDLSGVERAAVSLRWLESNEPIRTLAEYYRPAQPLSPTRLALQGLYPVAVPDLAREEQVVLVLELEGQLPHQPWQAQLQACASLWARVHYFQLVF